MAVPAEHEVQSLAGRRLGRYEVLTQLAAGGMAAVYVARAQGVAGFERLVAVKVLHPHLAHEEEFITMFLDEARLAARIRHPNVVPTLDISDTEGAGFFLVMDYVEGDHLGALLRASVLAKETLPPAVTVRVMMDALAGLGAAHSLTDEHGTPLKIVHRDVSPHNIMVGVDGVSRLTDFGVAKAEVRLTNTRDGQFKGKLGYMAPEHASTGEADQRSDLFSMGIILWECLMGRRLFRGETNAQTLHKILHEPVPSVAAGDPKLAPFDPVLEKALARPPEERFQSADDFLEALEAAAMKCEGTGSARAVAGTVRKYAGQKLVEDRTRIKDAMSRLGYSAVGETPLPMPGDGSGSRSYRKAEGEGAEGATAAERPSVRLEAADERKKRSPLLVVGAIAVVLGLVGAAIAVVASQTDGAADAPADTATAPPSEVHVTPPTPEVDPVAPPETPPTMEETHGDLGTSAEETAVTADTVRTDRTMRRRRDPSMSGTAATTTEGTMETTVEVDPTMEPTMDTTATMDATMRPADDLISNPYRR